MGNLINKVVAGTMELKDGQTRLTSLGLKPEALNMERRDLARLSRDLRRSDSSGYQHLGQQIHDRLSGKNEGSLDDLVLERLRRTEPTVNRTPNNQVFTAGKFGDRDQQAMARERIAGGQGIEGDFRRNINPPGVEAGGVSPGIGSGNYPLATTNPAGTTALAVVPRKASKETSKQASNAATAGSEVSSTKAAGISGYNLDRNPMTTLLTAGAGGLMGGAISYASGGEFSQGALAGTMGGLAMRAGGHVLNSNKELAGKMSTGLQSATSAFVDNNRQAMLAGAGLTGFVFGGKRESKKRGFNSSRGNGF